MDNLRTLCKRFAPLLQAILRVVVAALFIEHGGSKILGIPGALHGPPQLPPLISLMGISGLLELFGGFMFLVGFFTRPVAFILSGEMAVAYFTVHIKGPHWPMHNGGELAILYCFVFLYFVGAGAGPLSVDYFWLKRSPAKQA
jgi:putative oxidoreductase